MKKINTSYFLLHISKSGFTLIELLVVISIVVLLAAVITPGYAGRKEQVKLERSVELLAQSFRQLTEFTLSSQEFGPAGSTIIPEGGYGIYFTVPSSTATLFIDCNNNRRYDDPSAKPCGLPPNEFSEKVQDVVLDSEVTINSVNTTIPVNIIFQPPQPRMFVNGLPFGGTDVQISLTSAGRQKTIIINRAGLIDIEND